MESALEWNGRFDMSSASETFVCNLTKSVSYRRASAVPVRWTVSYKFWIDSERYVAIGSGSTSGEASDVAWDALEGVLDGLETAGMLVVLLVEE